MKRCLCNTVCIVLLLLSTGSVIVWVRSQGHWETWAIVRSDARGPDRVATVGWSIEYLAGRIRLNYYGMTDPPHEELLGNWLGSHTLYNMRPSEDRLEPNNSLYPTLYNFAFMGLAVHYEPVEPVYQGSRQWLAIVAPLWLITLMAAIAPALQLWRWVRWRRLLSVGHCKICGYDLRASKDRCPECGMAVPATTTEGKV